MEVYAHSTRLHVCESDLLTCAILRPREVGDEVLYVLVGVACSRGSGIGDQPPTEKSTSQQEKAERIFHAWDAPHTRDHPTAGSSTPDSRVEHCALLPLCQQPRSPPARTRLHTPLPRSPTCFLFLRSIMGSIRALALLLGLSRWAAYACFDYTCFGVTMCNDGEFAGECDEPRECPPTAIQMATNGVVQIRGWRCRVTLEQIRLAFPNVLTKEDTTYTLNNKIWIRDGAILEIHGASQASSADTAVSLLKLKVYMCASP